jgi:uncharacterized membrane protein YbhN (UPF0104 family)
MRRYLRRVLLVMLIGIALYGLFVLYAGYREIRSCLAAFRYYCFAVALGLASLNYALRFLKWDYYLARLEIRGVRKVDSLLIFLSGFVLTVTPGKVGEVFKSAVLRETHAVPAARTAPIVVAERLTDVTGVIVLIVLGSAGFAGGLSWAAAGTVFVLLGLTLILWPAPGQHVAAWLRQGPRRLRPLAPKLDVAFDSLRVLASPRALLWPTLLSIVGWGCEGLALCVLLHGFGTPAPVPLGVFFYATATLAGAIVPVPGGLGVTEAIMQEGLVRLGGIPQGPATAAMLLTRFATLWWAVVVGFAALAVLKARFPSLLRSDAAVVQAARPKAAE